MRDAKTQERLDSLTDEEKYIRTSVEWFRSRSTLLTVMHSKLCYLTENEMPHDDRWDIQRILRGMSWMTHKKLFSVAYELYGDVYNITMHPQKEKSVKMRPHLHIYN